MIDNLNLILYLYYCRILEAGGQIEKALGLHEVDHLGFSKKYTRFLQVHLDFIFLLTSAKKLVFQVFTCSRDLLTDS